MYGLKRMRRGDDEYAHKANVDLRGGMWTRTTTTNTLGSVSKFTLHIVYTSIYPE